MGHKCSRLNNAAEKVKSKLAQWDMESPFWKKRQLNMWSDSFEPVTPVLSGRVSALRPEGHKFYIDGRVIKKTWDPMPPRLTLSIKRLNKGVKPTHFTHLGA